MFKSETLEHPFAVVAAGELLVVGDRRAVHILSNTGTLQKTIDNVGEGPGEFRSVSAVGAWSGDSIAVYDAGLNRLSIFPPTLDGVAVYRVTRRLPNINVRRWNRVIVNAGGGLVMLMETPMTPDVEVSARAVVVWYDVQHDSATTLWGMDDLRYVNVPGAPAISPTTLFAERQQISLSNDGLVAYGDGMEYCVRVVHILAAVPPRMVCKTWRRSRVGPRIRNPDFSEWWNPEVVSRAHDMKTIPEFMPSFDRIHLDNLGRLWVRVVDDQVANIHPNILEAFPERGPTHRRWDLFSETGEHVRAHMLPSTFAPQLFTRDRAIGLYEAPTGEYIVSECSLTAQT